MTVREDTSHGASQGFHERREQLVEAAPVLFVIATLSVKLLYFSFAIAPEGEWLRSPGWVKSTLQAATASLGSLLLLFAPLILISTKRRVPMLWAGSFAVTLLIYADVLYIRYFGDVLSVSALGAARQLGMITGSIVALMEPADVLFFADFIVLFALLRCTSPSLPRRPPRRLGYLLLGTGALLVVYPAVAIIQRGEYDYFKLRGVARIGLLNYHAYDMARQLYLGATASRVGATERERVRAFLERNRPPAAPVSELFGVARGKNLIMLMVESLHSFPIGLVVNGTEVTPHLNRLARHSMTFENFYDQTWHGVTSDGEFTSLQSLHPLPDGGVPTRYGTNRFFALPRVLSENCYGTVSAHGYSGAIWMMATAHRAYGFARSYFRESFVQTDRIGMGLSDASFFRQMLPRLRGEREPFMAYLVTLSTHFPFGLPPALRTPALAVPAGTLVGAYLQSVHQFDAALGEFLAGLEKSGLLDRSVLVLFGDHAAFANADELSPLLSRYAHYPERARGFDYRYWEVEKRLPLLIHLPGDAAAGVRSGSAGHLDIAPTVLTLLGISQPRMVALGRDLSGGGNSFVVFRNGGFVVGDTACVPPSAAIPSTQCRNLRTGEALAPGEMRERFREAHVRLEMSDIILAGDLIPWASGLPGRSTRRADTASAGSASPSVLP